MVSHEHLDRCDDFLRVIVDDGIRRVQVSRLVGELPHPPGACDRARHREWTQVVEEHALSEARGVIGGSLVRLCDELIGVGEVALAEVAGRVVGQWDAAVSLGVGKREVQRLGRLASHDCVPLEVLVRLRRVDRDAHQCGACGTSRHALVSVDGAALRSAVHAPNGLRRPPRLVGAGEDGNAEHVVVAKQQQDFFATGQREHHLAPLAHHAPVLLEFWRFAVQVPRHVRHHVPRAVEVDHSTI